jgi:hypothetical protein
MPKPLTRPQPTSSVAKMLQPGVGAQVIAKAEAVMPSILPTPVQTTPIQERANQDEIRPSGEVPDIPRQFTLTAKTDRTLKRLIGTYSEATGMDLKHSELLRAVLVAVEHAMPELVREAQGIGPLRRPKNDRGREAEREELERRIARAFLAGVRAAGMMSD